MNSIYKSILGFELKINEDNILFFDLDGTLVDTNLANYLAYKKAIQFVMKADYAIPYKTNQRFNRLCLKTIIPNLSESEYEKIAQEKERYYEQFLNKTKLNKLIAATLIQYSETNRVVLVTNSQENRALTILKHYDLADKFNNLFCRRPTDKEDEVNKYKKAISCLKVPAQSVIVFENEKLEIKNAILAGIPEKNIIDL